MNLVKTDITDQKSKKKKNQHLVQNMLHYELNISCKQPIHVLYNADAFSKLKQQAHWDLPSHAPGRNRDGNNVGSPPGPENCQCLSARHGPCHFHNISPGDSQISMPSFRHCVLSPEIIWKHAHCRGHDSVTGFAKQLHSFASWSCTPT